MKILEKLRLQMSMACETGTWIAVDGWPCPTEKEQNLRKVYKEDLNRAIRQAYLNGVSPEQINRLTTAKASLVQRIVAIESLEP